nr:uncharacterized protein LOC129280570 [Lytechinus pictus]
MESQKGLSRARNFDQQANLRPDFQDASFMAHHNLAKSARRPQPSFIVQTSLYVFVAMVIMACALIHLFIYRRRRKAKKKKQHTYENTNPGKSGRSFLIDSKLFEKKPKTTSKVTNPEVHYKEPAKALCYSIVDITDNVSTKEHFTQHLTQSTTVPMRQHLNHLRKSEPDLRKSGDYYESIQIPPQQSQDNRKGFASNAKSKASEATAKLKKFGANKKTKLQRTFQSLTNLCVTNLDSCEDLSKGKDTSKCDYNRLMTPPSQLGRSVGNIYDTLSRQNPWKLASRGHDRYEDIEVQILKDEKLSKKNEKKGYQSISIPKYCPEKGQYKEGPFPLTGLAGSKTPKWRCNRFWRQSKSSEYDHVELKLPMCTKSSRKPSVAPKRFSPIYFTLDPSLKPFSKRTHFNNI